MPGKNDKAPRDFIDDLSDEKLLNFSTREKTLVEDRKLGFRLDHQGVNSDGSKKDRLYIQPIGGKSGVSKGSKGNVLAQIHVTDPGNTKDIRDALWRSWKAKHDLIKLD